MRCDVTKVSLSEMLQMPLNELALYETGTAMTVGQLSSILLI